MLNGFSFALVCGIIVGTYSSVFVASPILIFWHNFLEGRKRSKRGGPVRSAQGRWLQAGGSQDISPAARKARRRGAAKVK